MAYPFPFFRDDLISGRSKWLFAMESGSFSCWLSSNTFPECADIIVTLRGFRVILCMMEMCIRDRYGKSQFFLDFGRYGQLTGNDVVLAFFQSVDTFA